MNTDMELGQGACLSQREHADMKPAPGESSLQLSNLTIYCISAVRTAEDTNPAALRSG